MLSQSCSGDESDVEWRRMLSGVCVTLDDESDVESSVH